MKILKRTFLIIILILVLFGGIQMKAGYEKYIVALNQKSLNYAVAEIQSKENYTRYKNIPEIYFEALVAVEDRRFYKHNGFDIIGIIRAIYNDIKALELLEGGSTISQQLAKNMYFPQDNTLSRKISEIFMAMKIEREYDKEEVLELYVNGIYYGSGYYCIYDAAKGYFGKTPIELTDFECTLLVAIPNAPSVYSLDVNPNLVHQ